MKRIPCENGNRERTPGIGGSPRERQSEINGIRRVLRIIRTTGIHGRDKGKVKVFATKSLYFLCFCGFMPVG